MQATEHYAQTHYCPDCRDKTRLVLRRTSKGDEVICWGCRRTDGFKRRKSATQLWRDDPQAVPVHVANTLARKHRAEIEAQIAGLPPDLAETVRQKFGL